MTVQWGPEWPELYLGVEFVIGSFTDISSYVRSLDIVRPTSEETGTYSPATMTVVLDNRDGRFSASNLSGPYTSGGATLVLPEITVRYVATWDSVDFPRFTGMVEDWVDEYPENGEDAVTVLTCVDHLARFAQWTGSGAYTSPDGATSGDIVTSIADSVSLDLTWRDIETGDETHAPIEFTGNGLDLLHDLCDSEGGAVWWEPQIASDDGGLRFIGRSTKVTDSRHTTNQAVFGPGDIQFRDPVMSSPRMFIVRQAAFTGATGVEQQTGSGVPRIVRAGMSTASDTGVMAIAELEVAKGDPADNLRVREITVEPIADGSWADVLALRMQDRCEVTVEPRVSGTTATLPVFVDGLVESVRPMQYTLTFSFQSATAWSGFASSLWDTGEWDDATWFF